MLRKRFGRKRERRHIGYKAKRRIVFAISLIVLSLLYLFRNVSFVILAFSSVALLVVFYLADHMFDIRFKTRHYLFITVIAITGFLLSDLYTLYPTYDKILHFVQPMMFGAIFFRMVSDLNIELKWRLLFVFFIVSGSVGLFEIGEWTLDKSFDLGLQGVYIRDLDGGQALETVQDPLDDTMIDMALGVLGAGIYIGSIVLFFRKRV